MRFSAVAGNNCSASHVPNSVAYDIEGEFENGWIELGSYGARQALFGTWLYGTGLAEPRFSKVLHAPRS